MEKLSQDNEKLSRDEALNMIYGVFKDFPLINGLPIASWASDVNNQLANLSKLKPSVVADLQTEIANLKRDMNNLIHDSKLARKALEGKLEDYADENGILSREVDKLKFETDYIKAKMKEIEKENKSLKAKLEKEIESNEKLSKQVTDLALQFAKLSNGHIGWSTGQNKWDYTIGDTPKYIFEDGRWKLDTKTKHNTLKSMVKDSMKLCVSKENKDVVEEQA